MNPNETRSPHPSLSQVETLVKFMERNTDMAKGFSRTHIARQRSRRQWEELAVRLNSIGGTKKNSKQWIKYWSDKKGAIKRKIAARSAARRGTGGGVEDEVELTKLEERVAALCSGESLSTGDAHLGIQPFPENDTPSPSHAVLQIEDADTDNIHLPQQQQSQEPPAIVIYGSDLIEYSQEETHNYSPPHPVISTRLCASSSSSTVGTSQSILQNIQLEPTPPPNPHIYHPSLSPPPITLSYTPTPPSRRDFTQVASPVIRHRTLASSSSRPATPIASPFRRPRTNMARASRGAGSVSSRHTSSVAAPPPSHRRTEFSTTTERFLRVEEQQLEIQRLNAQILQSFLERSAERERVMDERNAERDRMLAGAVAAVGKGLQALAEAKRGYRDTDETKILIAKVHHYFEQEYKELKTIYGDLDLTPLSKFRQRTALATGVSEKTILEILNEEEGRNADKQEEPPEERRGARKRSIQAESSSEEDSLDDNTDADKESNSLDEAQTMAVKAEPENDNDEPESYVPAAVKEELSDNEVNKEQPQTSPIAFDVNTEPQSDVLDNTNETLALTEPAATKRKGRKTPRRGDVTPTRTSTNETLALTEPAATNSKVRKMARSGVIYTLQHTQGESSTAAASSSVRLTEELDEDSLLGDTEMKTILVEGAELFNDLPEDLKRCENINIFKAKLKKHVCTL